MFIATFFHQNVTKNWIQTGLSAVSDLGLVLFVNLGKFNLVYIVPLQHFAVGTFSKLALFLLRLNALRFFLEMGAMHHKIAACPKVLSMRDVHPISWGFFTPSS